MKYNIGDLFLYQSRTLKTSLTLVSYDGDIFELEWRNEDGELVKTPYTHGMMDSYLRMEAGWKHYPVKT